MTCAVDTCLQLQASWCEVASVRAGIKRVLVPKRNWRDVKADVPANIKDSLQVIPVHVLEDVLQHAFDPPVALHSLSKM